MDQQRWKLTKSIFQAALDLSPAERETFIATKCDDIAMRNEVLNMLQLHTDGTDFLRSPLGSPQDRVGSDLDSADDVFDTWIGQRLDNFEIVKRIGSGGMGTVFAARQERPERAAAIKIINPTGRLSQKDLLRFEHEAEILARLQHPGIAQVYAAGWHDIGQGEQPWFAMELIDGQPLHQFANEHQLTTKQKILLLLSICDAVQHAHGRGVIHRDLKPANILIVQGDCTPTDVSTSSGQPKIVDFGVARVMDTDRQATLQTVAGDILGTLNYMCPEQVADDTSMIDGRCDVYALGVIGFELLVGSLPHDRRGGSIATCLRRVEQDTPQRLGQVNPAFRGDLEVIIAKAIEKDPARRYRSVQQLADDLQRFLNRQPILARPPATTYLFYKFASRHLGLVGGIAATFAALIIGIVLYANEARQARQAADHSRYEAEKATAISNFMTNDFLMKLLAAANEREITERLPTSELVQRAAEKVPAMFGDQPTIEAAVRNEVGTVYYNLGSFERAANEFDLALHLWQSNLGHDHPDTLKAVNNLGLSYNHLGRRDEAETLLRRALKGRIDVLGESNAFTLASMNNLADLLLRESTRSDEAEVLLRRTLQLQQRATGADDKDSFVTMINLGTLLRQRGEISEAQSLHCKAFKASRASLGEDHVVSLKAGSCYAQTLHRAGLYEDALRILVPISQSFARVLGRENRDTITARRLLAIVYRDCGQVEKAKEQLQKTLDDLLASDQPPSATITRLRQQLKSLPEPAPNLQPVGKPIP